MKENQPITNKEVSLKPGSNLITTTDLKGTITYVNQDFMEISGFAEPELIGRNHNVIRHPDMPPAAFEDLWATVKKGKPWRGMVKNRCKNGDHYWVEAFVTPVVEDGKVTGYQSIRSEATRAQVREAEQLYARLRRDPKAKMPKPFRLGDVGIMQRMTVAMLVIGLLPLLGLGLWTAGWVSEAVGIGLAVAAPLLMALFGLYVYRTMFIPMNRLVHVVHNMASGRLNCKLDHPHNDELGDLYTAMRMLQSSFRTVVGQMSEVSIDLATSAEQVSNSSTETFQLMFRQQQSTEQAGNSIAQMRDSVQEVADNTQNAVTVAGEANTAAITGKGTITHLRSTIENLVEEVGNSSQVIADLNAKSQDITKILEVIRAIAEQTNLLALNAAIEAARAGEQGRGFAVVADEVRTLAGRTADATGEINSVIEQLQQGIDNAIDVMEKGQSKADEATTQSTEALQSIDELTMAVVRMNAMNAQIAESASAQLQAAESVNMEMGSVKDMAAQTLALTQSNSEAGNHLTVLSADMLKQFNRFGLTEDLQASKEASKQKLAEQKATEEPQSDDSILF